MTFPIKTQKSRSKRKHYRNFVVYVSTNFSKIYIRMGPLKVRTPKVLEQRFSLWLPHFIFVKIMWNFYESTDQTRDETLCAQDRRGLKQTSESLYLPSALKHVGRRIHRWSGDYLSSEVLDSVTFLTTRTTTRPTCFLTYHNTIQYFVNSHYRDNTFPVPAMLLFLIFSRTDPKWVLYCFFTISIIQSFRKLHSMPRVLLPISRIRTAASQSGIFYNRKWKTTKMKNFQVV
jgi:hypothetical protein